MEASSSTHTLRPDTQLSQTFTSAVDGNGGPIPEVATASATVEAPWPPPPVEKALVTHSVGDQRQQQQHHHHQVLPASAMRHESAGVDESNNACVDLRWSNFYYNDNTPAASIPALLRDRYCRDLGRAPSPRGRLVPETDDIAAGDSPWTSQPPSLVAASMAVRHTFSAQAHLTTVRQFACRCRCSTQSGRRVGVDPGDLAGDDDWPRGSDHHPHALGGVLEVHCDSWNRVPSLQHACARELVLFLADAEAEPTAADGVAPTEVGMSLVTRVGLPCRSSPSSVPSGGEPRRTPSNHVGNLPSESGAVPRGVDDAVGVTTCDTPELVSSEVLCSTRQHLPEEVAVSTPVSHTFAHLLPGRTYVLVHVALRVLPENWAEAGDVLVLEGAEITVPALTTCDSWDLRVSRATATSLSLHWFSSTPYAAVRWIPLPEWQDRCAPGCVRLGAATAVGGSAAETTAPLLHAMLLTSQHDGPLPLKQSAVLDGLEPATVFYVEVVPLTWWDVHAYVEAGRAPPATLSKQRHDQPLVGAEHQALRPPHRGSDSHRDIIRRTSCVSCSSFVDEEGPPLRDLTCASLDPAETISAGHRSPSAVLAATCLLPSVASLSVRATVVEHGNAPRITSYGEHGSPDDSDDGSIDVSITVDFAEPLLANGAMLRRQFGCSPWVLQGVDPFRGTQTAARGVVELVVVPRLFLNGDCGTELTLPLPQAQTVAVRVEYDVEIVWCLSPGEQRSRRPPPTRWPVDCALVGTVGPFDLIYSLIARETLARSAQLEVVAYLPTGKLVIHVSHVGGLGDASSSTAGRSTDNPTTETMLSSWDSSGETGAAATSSIATRSSAPQPTPPPRPRSLSHADGCVREASDTTGASASTLSGPLRTYRLVVSNLRPLSCYRIQLLSGDQASGSTSAGSPTLPLMELGSPESEEAQGSPTVVRFASRRVLLGTSEWLLYTRPPSVELMGSMDYSTVNDSLETRLGDSSCGDKLGIHAAMCSVRRQLVVDMLSRGGRSYGESDPCDLAGRSSLATRPRDASSGGSIQVFIHPQAVDTLWIAECIDLAPGKDSGGGLVRDHSIVVANRGQAYSRYVVNLELLMMTQQACQRRRLDGGGSPSPAPAAAPHPFCVAFVRRVRIDPPVVGMSAVFERSAVGYGSAGGGGQFIESEPSIRYALTGLRCSIVRDGYVTLQWLSLPRFALALIGAGPSDAAPAATRHHALFVTPSLWGGPFRRLSGVHPWQMGAKADDDRRDARHAADRGADKSRETNITVVIGEAAFVVARGSDWQTAADGPPRTLPTSQLTIGPRGTHPRPQDEPVAQFAVHLPLASLATRTPPNEIAHCAFTASHASEYSSPMRGSAIGRPPCMPSIMLPLRLSGPLVIADTAPHFVVLPPPCPALAANGGTAPQPSAIALFSSVVHYEAVLVLVCSLGAMELCESAALGPFTHLKRYITFGLHIVVSHPPHGDTPGQRGGSALHISFAELRSLGSGPGWTCERVKRHAAMAAAADDDHVELRLALPRRRQHGCDVHIRTFVAPAVRLPGTTAGLRVEAANGERHGPVAATAGEEDGALPPNAVGTESTSCGTWPTADDGLSASDGREQEHATRPLLLFARPCDESLEPDAVQTEPLLSRQELKITAPPVQPIGGLRIQSTSPHTAVVRWHAAANAGPTVEVQRYRVTLIELRRVQSKKRPWWRQASPLLPSAAHGGGTAPRQSGAPGRLHGVVHVFDIEYNVRAPDGTLEADAVVAFTGLQPSSVFALCVSGAMSGAHVTWKLFSTLSPTPAFWPAILRRLSSSIHVDGAIGGSENQGVVTVEIDVEEVTALLSDSWDGPTQATEAPLPQPALVAADNTSGLMSAVLVGRGVSADVRDVLCLGASVAFVETWTADVSERHASARPQSSSDRDSGSSGSDGPAHDGEAADGAGDEVAFELLDWMTDSPGAVTVLKRRLLVAIGSRSAAPTSQRLIGIHMAKSSSAWCVGRVTALSVRSGSSKRACESMLMSRTTSERLAEPGSGATDVQERASDKRKGAVFHVVASRAAEGATASAATGPSELPPIAVSQQSELWCPDAPVARGHMMTDGLACGSPREVCLIRGTAVLPCLCGSALRCVCYDRSPWEYLHYVGMPRFVDVSCGEGRVTWVGTARAYRVSWLHLSHGFTGIVSQPWPEAKDVRRCRATSSGGGAPPAATVTWPTGAQAPLLLLVVIAPASTVTEGGDGADPGGEQCLHATPLLLAIAAPCGVPCLHGGPDGDDSMAIAHSRIRRADGLNGVATVQVPLPTRHPLPLLAQLGGGSGAGCQQLLLAVEMLWFVKRDAVWVSCVSGHLPWYQCHPSKDASTPHDSAGTPPMPPLHMVAQGSDCIIHVPRIESSDLACAGAADACQRAAPASVDLLAVARVVVVTDGADGARAAAMLPVQEQAIRVGVAGKSLAAVVAMLWSDAVGSATAEAACEAPPSAPPLLLLLHRPVEVPHHLPLAPQHGLDSLRFTASTASRSSPGLHDDYLDAVMAVTLTLSWRSTDSMFTVTFVPGDAADPFIDDADGGRGLTITTRTTSVDVVVGNAEATNVRQLEPATVYRVCVRGCHSDPRRALCARLLTPPLLTAGSVALHRSCDGATVTVSSSFAASTGAAAGDGAVERRWQQQGVPAEIPSLECERWIQATLRCPVSGKVLLTQASSPTRSGEPRGGHSGSHTVTMDLHPLLPTRRSPSPFVADVGFCASSVVLQVTHYVGLLAEARGDDGIPTVAVSVDDAHVAVDSAQGDASGHVMSGRHGVVSRVSMTLCHLLALANLTQLSLVDVEPDRCTLAWQCRAASPALPVGLSLVATPLLSHAPDPQGGCGTSSPARLIVAAEDVSDRVDPTGVHCGSAAVAWKRSSRLSQHVGGSTASLSSDGCSGSGRSGVHAAWSARLSALTPATLYCVSIRSKRTCPQAISHIASSAWLAQRAAAMDQLLRRKTGEAVRRPVGVGGATHRHGYPAALEAATATPTVSIASAAAEQVLRVQDDSRAAPEAAVLLLTPPSSGATVSQPMCRVIRSGIGHACVSVRDAITVTPRRLIAEPAGMGELVRFTVLRVRAESVAGRGGSCVALYVPETLLELLASRPVPWPRFSHVAAHPHASSVGGSDDGSAVSELSPYSRAAIVEELRQHLTPALGAGAEPPLLYFTAASSPAKVGEPPMANIHLEEPTTDLPRRPPGTTDATLAVDWYHAILYTGPASPAPSAPHAVAAPATSAGDAYSASETSVRTSGPFQPQRCRHRSPLPIDLALSADVTHWLDHPLLNPLAVSPEPFATQPVPLLPVLRNVSVGPTAASTVLTLEWNWTLLAPGPPAASCVDPTCVHLDVRITPLETPPLPCDDLPWPSVACVPPTWNRPREDAVHLEGLRPATAYAVHIDPFLRCRCSSSDRAPQQPAAGFPHGAYIVCAPCKVMVLTPPVPLRPEQCGFTVTRRLGEAGEGVLPWCEEALTVRFVVPPSHGEAHVPGSAAPGGVVVTHTVLLFAVPENELRQRLAEQCAAGPTADDFLRLAASTAAPRGTWEPQVRKFHSELNGPRHVSLQIPRPRNAALASTCVAYTAVLLSAATQHASVQSCCYAEPCMCELRLDHFAPIPVDSLQVLALPLLSSPAEWRDFFYQRCQRAMLQHADTAIVPGAIRVLQRTRDSVALALSLEVGPRLVAAFTDTHLVDLDADADAQWAATATVVNSQWVIYVDDARDALRQLHRTWRHNQELGRRAFIADASVAVEVDAVPLFWLAKPRTTPRLPPPPPRPVSPRQCSHRPHGLLPRVRSQSTPGRPPGRPRAVPAGGLNVTTLYRESACDDSQVASKGSCNRSESSGSGVTTNGDPILAEPVLCDALMDQIQAPYKLTMPVRVPLSDEVLDMVDGRVEAKGCSLAATCAVPISQARQSYAFRVRVISIQWRDGPAATAEVAPQDPAPVPLERRPPAGRLQDDSVTVEVAAGWVSAAPAGSSTIVVSAPPLVPPPVSRIRVGAVGSDFLAVSWSPAWEQPVAPDEGGESDADRHSPTRPAPPTPRGVGLVHTSRSRSNSSVAHNPSDADTCGQSGSAMRRSSWSSSTAMSLNSTSKATQISRDRLHQRRRMQQQTSSGEPLTASTSAHTDQTLTNALIDVPRPSHYRVECSIAGELMRRRAKRSICGRLQSPMLAEADIADLDTAAAAGAADGDADDNTVHHVKVPGYQHAALLTGLRPNTFYRVVVLSCNALGECTPHRAAVVTARTTATEAEAAVLWAAAPAAKLRSNKPVL